MIRGMIGPTFFTVYIKTISIYILYQRALSYAGDWGCFLKGPTGPWHSKARFGYDSGYVSGMIRGMTRAGDCVCKNKVESRVSLQNPANKDDD